MITPFPEPESPELERFAVYGEHEISTLLTELRDRRILVTLYYDHAAGFTVSNVVAVDAARDELVLDCAADPSVRRAVELAREIVAIAFLDSSKLQFRVSRAEPVMHEARPSFRISMPRRLLRMQRRNAPRRQPPATQPAVCLVPVPGERGRYESVRVLDIGIGGVALLAPPVLFELARDQVLDGCYLDLPDVGQIAVGLRVRYMDAWPGEGGGRRCGCQFVDLAGAALRSLQRYLNRLDAQQGDGTLRAA